jgi:hypothetical protein
MTLQFCHQSPKLTYLKNLFFLVSIAATSVLTAQQRTPLNGKLKSDAEDLEGIYIINKTADFSVTTTRGGYFTIPAIPSDTIIFSAVNIIAKEIVLDEADVKSTLLIVPVEKYVHQLEELIIVDYSHINAESLGLVPKGQKQYTSSEKRLLTASSSRMNPMGLDPLFNALSGRTKMLKKANETAKKEVLMEKIDYIYTEEELITKFNIPQEYVRGFVYYLVEDDNFARALKNKNETMAKFLMSGLAGKYLELIKDEK